MGQFAQPNGMETNISNNRWHRLSSGEKIESLYSYTAYVKMQKCTRMWGKQCDKLVGVMQINRHTGGRVVPSFAHYKFMRQHPNEISLFPNSEWIRYLFRSKRARWSISVQRFSHSTYFKVRANKIEMGQMSILTMITMMCIFGYSFALPTIDEMHTANADKEVCTFRKVVWSPITKGSKSECMYSMLDSQYTRDLMDWITAQQANGNESPCESKESIRSIIRYLRSVLPSGYWAPTQLLAKKRNSELINSLLSIPKTMNDAGK